AASGSDVKTILQTLYPDPTKADAAEKELYLRAQIEQFALQQRHELQTAVLKGRLWTRFMGFLTGMILCLCGAVFVLAKLRESVSMNLEGQGIKAGLSTASPGIGLAFAGTVLIAFAL